MKKLIIKPFYNCRLYHFKIGGEIKITWRKQGMVTNVQDLVDCIVFTILLETILQCRDVRQDRISHRLISLSDQG